MRVVSHWHRLPKAVSALSLEVSKAICSGLAATWDSGSVSPWQGENGISLKVPPAQTFWDSMGRAKSMTLKKA